LIKAFLSLTFCLVLAACGKHESSSYGFSNTGNTKQGDKAGTQEEVLLLAIVNGDSQVFTSTLLLLTDVNVRLKEERTFLIEAARSKKALFVYQLLQKGADRTLVDTFQKTAFDYASENDDKKIQFLLDDTQFPKIQAEMWTAVAALASSKNVMAAIEAGADPNLYNEQGETVLTFLIKSLDFSNSKNKAPLILKEVIDWKDEEFGLTKTKASQVNTLNETPLALLESKLQNTQNDDEIKKINSLIQRLQKVLEQEIP
jgi:hypothetical protein